MANGGPVERLVYRLVEDTPGRADEARAGMREVRHLTRSGIHVIEVPPQAKEARRRALERNPNVAYVEDDELVPVPATPQTAQTLSGQPLVLPDVTVDPDVLYAIADSGISESHDLQGSQIRYDLGYNVPLDSTAQADLTDRGEDAEGPGDVGHGTGCAIVAVGNGWNGDHTGIAPGGRAIPIVTGEMIDGSFQQFSSDIAAGIEYATSIGVQVLIVSAAAAGGGTFRQSTADIIWDAWLSGVLVVIASGNDATLDRPSYPAHYDGALAVTSVRHDLTWFDDQPGAIAAYRPYLRTGNDGTGSSEMHGTSFTAPQVAGAAILLWSANPDLTNEQVRDLLLQSADPYTDYQDAPNPDSGLWGFEQVEHGLLNIEEAFNLLGQVTTPAPPRAVGSLPTLEDDFNRPDTVSSDGLGTTSVGSASWQTLVGGANIANNFARLTPDTIAVVDLGTGQQSPQVDVPAALPIDGTALYFRVVDTINWWRWRIHAREQTNTLTWTEYLWHASYGAGEAFDEGAHGHNDSREQWTRDPDVSPHPSSYTHRHAVGSLAGTWRHTHPRVTNAVIDTQQRSSTYLVRTFWRTLDRAVGGVVTTLVSEGANSTAPTLLRVRAIADTVEVYHEDRGLLGTIHDSTHLTATLCGIGMAADAPDATIFDNFVAIPNINAPFMPTLLSPANGQTHDFAADPRFRWAHNDADPGDHQEAYQLRIKQTSDADYQLFDGSALVAPQTGELDATNPDEVIGATIIESTDEETELRNADGLSLLDNLEAHQWSVRTRDTAGLWGPWATDASCPSSTRPVATIVTSADLVDYSTKPTFVGDYADADGDAQQSSRWRVWRKADYDDAGVHAGPIAASGLTPAVQNQWQVPDSLENESDYVLGFQVESVGDHESQWDVVAFRLDVAAPSAPTLTAQVIAALAKTVARIRVHANLHDQRTADPEADNIGGWTPEVGTLQGSDLQARTSTGSMLITTDGAGDYLIVSPLHAYGGDRPLTGLQSILDAGDVGGTFRQSFRYFDEDLVQIGTDVGAWHTHDVPPPPEEPVVPTFEVVFSRSADRSNPSDLEGAEI